MKRKVSAAVKRARSKSYYKKRKETIHNDQLASSLNETDSEDETRLTPNNVDSAYFSARSTGSQLSKGRSTCSQLTNETPTSSITPARSRKRGTRRSNLETRLVEQFQNTIEQSATIVCQICRRCMYPSSIKKYKTTPKILTIFARVDINLTEGNFNACWTFHRTLNVNNKLPAHAYNNMMDPGVIPAELEDLNDVELRLISRIKPFMKIYK